MRLSRPARMLLSIGGALGLVVGLAAPAALAADVSFGTPSATATFGTGVTFVQPVNVSGTIARAELLITFPAALGPLVHEVPVPSGSGAVTLRYVFLQADASLFPNTKLTARWRITSVSGPAAIGPAVTVTYADTTKQWKTLEGALIRLHWYSGSAAFAQQALALGEQGVQKAADLLGVTETVPIDFFVYDDEQSFCLALLSGSTCNFAGRAIVSNRTMFGLIGSNQANSAEVARVIPHELTHLVFDTATRNPYHSPADWLNEGLAVYLTEGVAPYLRSALDDAMANGKLLPLTAFAIAFPPQELYDRFLLAYGESVSAVDYFVRTYGKARLASLIRSYAAGRTDDEAFSAAIGLDVPGFEAAWLADLGAATPHRYGPQPAPAGPLPPGWSGPASVAPSDLGSSAPASGSVPASSTSPGGAAAPAVPNAGASAGDGASTGLILVAIVAAGLVVGAVLGYLRRRRILRAASIPAAGPPGQDPSDPGSPSAVP